MRGTFDHPVLAEAGWWRRAAGPSKSVQARMPSHAGLPILILGGAGNLGRALKRVADTRGLACRNLSRYEADVRDPASLRRALDRHRPWAVVNAAGYTSIDDAETDAERCFEINSTGALNAASVCAEKGIAHVAISTDLVFDGAKSGPYVESDDVGPLSVYGRSKFAGEKSILARYADALVIRASPLFDPRSSSHFAAQVLRPENSGPPLVLPGGRVSPTYTIDLCEALLDLLIDGESGIWHLANVGSVTWSEFAGLLFDMFSVPARELHGEAAFAQRPEQSVLISEKASLMPSLENALGRFLQEFGPVSRGCEWSLDALAR
jgi:dTDP-4-dehydrorhamnose reductase